MSILAKEDAILTALANVSTTLGGIAQTQTEMSQALASIAKVGGAQFDPSQLLALAQDADDNSKTLLAHVENLEALVGSENPTSATAASGSGSASTGTGTDTGSGASS